ncbi:MAG TPA: HlyD family efflux transporter periplasmic adaptor subunit [Usitatibacter sp.]|nr:HlyD family efflux transporter periplasmic adaptor subunit [Usitatibacter sp.]
MSAGLFRAQVRAHAENAWLGTIVLIRPLSFTFLTACALAMAAALAAFLVEGEYTRKARVAGVLAPEQGMVRLLAQQTGIVERVAVAEGDEVAREATLLVLGDGRESGSREDIGGAVASRLGERQAALERQRASTAAAARAEQAALERRRADLAREVAQIDSEIATQSERTALASRNAERSRALERTGFLSRAALDRERDAEMEQRSRLEGLRRSRLQLERDLDAVGFDQAAAHERAAAQLAAIDLQRAALDQERLERGLQYRAEIVAPAAGTVATVLVEAGQMVVPGTALATIIPRPARLEAHLYSPSRSIGFVRAGQEVLVRYLAYPYQKFGSYRARVVAISRNPMSASELGFVAPDGSREPLYRIKAALESQSVLAYGRPQALQAGMQVEADILLDRRRLIEWIFEPLLGLAGRAAPAPGS